MWLVVSEKEIQDKHFEFLMIAESGKMAEIRNLQNFDATFKKINKWKR